MRATAMLSPIGWDSGMSTIAIMGAMGLACIGSGTAEYIRLRCRLIPDIRRSYGWSATTSVLVVMSNVMTFPSCHLGSHRGSGDVVLLVAGTVAYGVLWLLILMAWRHCRESLQA